jgi:hypothetical protein
LRIDGLGAACSGHGERQRESGRATVCGLPLRLDRLLQRRQRPSRRQQRGRRGIGQRGGEQSARHVSRAVAARLPRRLAAMVAGTVRHQHAERAVLARVDRLVRTSACGVFTLPSNWLVEIHLARARW